MYVVHYPTWTPLMKAIFIKMRRMQHNMILFFFERRGRYGIDKDIIYIDIIEYRYTRLRCKIA